MAKVTISFTIEEEQLARVDQLSTHLDRDRSSTLRLLIEAGMLAVDQPQPIRALVDRDQVQDYAAKIAEALRAGMSPRDVAAEVEA